ncbi:hypothetical protein JHK87_024972 [Glycine soja]|nr:hypothetical protein JHK87_024972 [Glycine soja]
MGPNQTLGKWLQPQSPKPVKRKVSSISINIIQNESRGPLSSVVAAASRSSVAVAPSFTSSHNNKGNTGKVEIPFDDTRLASLFLAFCIPLPQRSRWEMAIVMYQLVCFHIRVDNNISCQFVIMSGSGSNSSGGDTTAGGSSSVARNNLQVEQEQPLGESGSGSNVDLVGGSLTDPTLDAFDIDNLVLNDNVEDHFSIKEELEDDGDEDDGGGGGDIGDDFIRGLMDI